MKHLNCLIKKEISLFLLGIFLILFFSILFMVKGNQENFTIPSHQHNGKCFHQGIVNNIENSGGLIKNKFGMLAANGSENKIYYTHHPALFTTALYIFIKIFGENFANLFPLLISLCIIASIYFFIAKFINPFVAFWSSFLIGIHPIFLQYSVFFNYEPLILLLIIFVLIVISRRATKNKFNNLMVVFLLILSMLTDWPGYFLCLYSFLYYHLIKKKMKWNKFSFLLFFLPFIMFMMFLFHNRALTGAFNGGNLYRTFIGRISNVGETDLHGALTKNVPEYKNYLEFLVWFKNVIIENFPAGFLVSSFLLAILFIFGTLKIKKIIKKEIRILLFGICFVGFSYTLIFNSFTYYHDYSLLHIIPFFTIATVLLTYLIANYLWDIFSDISKTESAMFKNLFINLIFNGFWLFYLFLSFRGHFFTL